MIYIYYNNEWISYKSGNQAIYYIYNQGTKAYSISLLDGYNAPSQTSSTDLTYKSVENTTNICFPLMNASYSQFYALFGTVEAVDISKYNTIGIVYTENNITYTKEFDISDVTVKSYLGFTRYKTGAANGICKLIVSSDKANWETTQSTKTTLSWTPDYPALNIAMYISQLYLK
jgi:hypothetical protein